MHEDRSNHGTTLGIRYNGGSKAIRNNTGVVQRLSCTGHSYSHIINRICCISRIKVSSRVQKKDITYIRLEKQGHKLHLYAHTVSPDPSSDVVTVLTTDMVLWQTPRPTLPLVTDLCTRS